MECYISIASSTKNQQQIFKLLCDVNGSGGRQRVKRVIRKSVKKIWANEREIGSKKKEQKQKSLNRHNGIHNNIARVSAVCSGTVSARAKS